MRVPGGRSRKAAARIYCRVTTAVIAAGRVTRGRGGDQVYGVLGVEQAKPANLAWRGRLARRGGQGTVIVISAAILGPASGAGPVPARPTSAAATPPERAKSIVDTAIVTACAASLAARECY
jgi:hypothetical protein